MESFWRLMKTLTGAVALLAVGLLVVLNADGSVVIRLDGARAREIALPAFLAGYALTVALLGLLFALFDRAERRTRKSRMLKKIRALEREVEALRKLPLLDHYADREPAAAGMEKTPDRAPGA